MNTIDIDVGGTFTDLVLTLDGQALIARCRRRPTTCPCASSQRDRGRRGRGWG